MKKILSLFILFGLITIAQNFTIEKIKGDVQALRGSSEIWETVKIGDQLAGTDLIVTDEEGFIQLNRNGERFILQRNSALGLNHIKEVSINDLLLALAMEEIRNVPKNKNDEESRNTAVYGTEELVDSDLLPENDLGTKRLNGARQLAENGFKESSIIAAKETYRKYPYTKSLIDERLYFVNLLKELNLIQEAMDELTGLAEFDLSEKQSIEIENLLEELKVKAVTD